MIDLPFANGKTYAILGLGKTGLSAGEALLKSGVQIVAWDDNQKSRAHAATMGFTLQDLSTFPLDGITALVISPGIPTTFPAPHPIAKRFLDLNIPVFCDVELLLQAQSQAKIVGITGTNGKSTTTSLISHILSENKIKNAVGGNLGQAVMTLPAMGSDGVYVLELSSYQLELTPSLVCDVAVLLNITPDHLERHGGMPGYIAAKRLILRPGKKNQIFVIGIDDDITAKIAVEYMRKPSDKIIPISGQGTLVKVSDDIGFTLNRGTCVSDGFLYEDNSVVDNVSDIATLPGLHNAQNIAAAFTACRALGLAAEPIIAAIRTFPGLAHRQEIVEIDDGVTFINDSKATNVDAAAKALVCYKPIYWIAGGKPKEGGFDGLNPYLPNVHHAFLIGEAAEAMAQWLDQQGTPYTITETLPRAVQAAAHMAWQEDLDNAVVLLSPAAASFDQFPNFEARGDLFRDAVRALKVESGG